MRVDIILACAAVLALFAAAPAAALDMAELLRAEPDPANAGGELTLHGRDILPRSGSYRSTVKYAGADGRILGELPASGWRSGQVRVRLPPELTANTYRLAVFRNGELASNWIEVRVNPTIAPVRKIVSPMRTRALRGTIRAQGPNICAGEVTIRVTGGPFEPGTEIDRPHAFWLRGKTYVQLEVPGDPAASQFWNSMIFGVRIVSPHELHARVAPCFLTETNPRIRVIYPDGAVSPWAGVAWR